TNLPDGVTFEADELAGNYNQIPIVFSAIDEAEPDATLTSVAVRHSDDKQSITNNFQQQTWLVRGRNNRPVWSYFGDQAPVAVTKAVPFRITLQEPQAPLVRNGEMELRVIAEREGGFDQPVSVRMLYNPPGVSSNRSRSISKSQTEALIPVSANGNARVGNWQIAVLGETNVNGRVLVSTQLATLQISLPYFDIAVPTITTTPGDSAEMVVELSPRAKFEGEAELELVRLPPGVSAEKVKVTANETSATFNLIVSNQARTGRHRGVGCRARLQVNGEPVIYAQGYSDLRIDPPPIEPNATAAQELPAGQEGPT
ncbi:MAG: hypothetical protein MJA83_00160, partial [Gammaproteobacteria bacterium]|nr:hypothetical protein [Gammaproteobacteria bacterium]